MVLMIYPSHHVLLVLLDPARANQTLNLRSILDRLSGTSWTAVILWFLYLTSLLMSSLV
jgi:hypothetical protein